MKQVKHFAAFQQAKVALVLIFQLIVLIASLAFSSFRNKKKYSIVVGCVEISNVLNSLALSLPEAYVVCLRSNVLYSNSDRYDFFLNSSSGRWSYLQEIFFGPLLLGKFLCARATFILIGEKYFLSNTFIELTLMKVFGCKIVFHFLGDDIRSPRKQIELARQLEIHTFATLGWHLTMSQSDQYELKKQKTAELAHKFANLILTAPRDQASYLNSDDPRVVPFIGHCALPEGSFNWDSSKFMFPDPIVIVHAPTDEIVKGTTYVRATIRALREEGFVIDYRELTGVPHSSVTSELFSAHICLNQFLGLGPGILGFEAMAARCATFMSADPDLEPSILRYTNPAWVMASPETLTSKLRFYLTDWIALRDVANQGFQYATHNYSIEAASRRLRSILSRLTVE